MSERNAGQASRGLGRWALAYGVALVAIGAMDLAWLGVVAREFYRHELGALMAEQVRVVPAALYYLLYPLAIVYLALCPQARSLPEAMLRSAVLGAAAFGVYDLTNLATLRGYTLTMAVVDMAWGVFATTVAGALAHRFVLARRGRPAS